MIFKLTAAPTATLVKKKASPLVVTRREAIYLNAEYDCFNANFIKIRGYLN